MYPNPGAVNNLLSGRYREPTYVGGKRIAATSSLGEYPVALSTISGIAPGDFVFMALGRHSQSQGIVGGDGGWEGLSYPYTSPIFTSVVYWWKAGVTANDIANTKIKSFGGLNDTADIIVYRGVRRAVLRTSRYVANGTPDTAPPLKIPTFTRASDCLGVFAHIFSSQQPSTTTGPMSLYPSGAAMNARLDDVTPSGFRTYLADMLTNVSLFGQEVRAAGAQYPTPFHLGTYWELRAT